MGEVIGYTNGKEINLSKIFEDIEKLKKENQELRARLESAEGRNEELRKNFKTAQDINDDLVDEITGLRIGFKFMIKTITEL